MEEIMNFDKEKLIIETKNNISYIKFKKLLKFNNIEHGFYIGKELDFKTRDRNKINYKDNYVNYDKFFKLFNLDYRNCIKPNFNHSNNVIIVDKKVNSSEPDFDIYNDYDAIITNKPNLILTTTSSDCNLIFIYDPVENVIANIHSGWLGTFKEVSINTIKLMHDKFNCNYCDLYCFIMPSIRVCHFEVGNDVYLKFKEKFNNNKYYCFKNNKWHIDLVQIIIDGLINLGVDKNNIEDCNLCTMCNSDILHSYRVEKENFMVSAGFICLRK